MIRRYREDSYAKSPTWTELVYAYAEYNPVNLVDPTGHDAGNAGRDYSKRIVNKPTKTTAKNAKKSSSKSNTVAKRSVVGNQTKTQVKSVAKGTSNLSGWDKAGSVGKGLAGIWANRINNWRTGFQNIWAQQGFDPEITGQAFDATVAYAGGEMLAGAIGTGAKTIYGIRGAMPKPGSLSNLEARKWYLKQEAKIPSRIDDSLPLEQQAKRAFELRNKFRTQARELMADRELAQKLIREEPNLTWEQVIQKAKNKGLSGDDIYRQIIESSQRSRQSVNKSLGLE